MICMYAAICKPILIVGKSQIWDPYHDVVFTFDYMAPRMVTRFVYNHRVRAADHAAQL